MISNYARFFPSSNIIYFNVGDIRVRENLKWLLKINGRYIYGYISSNSSALQQSLNPLNCASYLIISKRG